MDMSEYCGSKFLKLDDVREPRIEVIADCRPGNFDRPDLTFESGDVLSANRTSCRALARAYGTDSQNWIGKTVKVYAGKVHTKDGDNDAVLIEPVSPPPTPKLVEHDDQIPF